MVIAEFFERKRVETKAIEGQKVTFNLALFDRLTIEDIFGANFSESAL